jgi:endonuclease IV
MNHPRLAGIPLILETPKEGPDGKVCPDNDRANLAALRGFVKAVSRAPKRSPKPPRK